MISNETKVLVDLYDEISNELDMYAYIAQTPAETLKNIDAILIDYKAKVIAEYRK